MRTVTRASFITLITLAGFTGVSFSESDISSSLDHLASQLLKGLPEGQPAKPLVVVLPLESSSELSHRRVGFAVTEVLKPRILSSEKCAVIETPLVQKVVKERHIQLNRFDNETAIQIGKTLNSDFVIAGSVQEGANKYQINVRLLSINDQQIISTAYYEISSRLFDEYAADYLVVYETPVMTKPTSERRSRLGKLGVEFFYAGVSHANSAQFKDTSGALGFLKLWLSDDVALEAGGALFDQRLKNDFLMANKMKMTQFLLGAQLRLDKGQRFVPYIGGGGVLVRATGFGYVPSSYVIGSGINTYFSEVVDDTSYGDYFNAGVTAYFSRNRNWSLSLDYRRINVNLDAKSTVTTQTYFPLPNSNTTTINEEKIDMDMELFNIGLGYHFQ